MGGELRVKGYVVLLDRLYTRTDEWVLVGDGVATVGITDYAQKKLRDIVGVELPEVGVRVRRGEAVAAVESIKAAADVYAPVSGVVVEVNSRLYDEPELLNRDPYGEGWMFRVRMEDRSELEGLLAPEAYARRIEEEES